MARPARRSARFRARSHPWPPRARRDRDQGRAERAASPRTRSARSTWATCCRPASARPRRARPPSARASRTRVRAVTINKVCGSGLKAVVLGAQAIAAGDPTSSSRAAWSRCPTRRTSCPRPRGGYRMGHARSSTRWSTTACGTRTPTCTWATAPSCAPRRTSRARQDAFAAESYRRALARAGGGQFRGEIVPVEIAAEQGRAVVVADDEEPGRGNIDKLPAAAGVPEGRHGHRGQRVVDQRRRGGAGAHGRGRGRGARAASRWRASSAPRSTRRRPSGSPPRRPARSNGC